MTDKKHVSGQISSDMPSYFQSKFQVGSDTPTRHQGKKIVKERIGNSHESPSYFRTEHGTVSETTYENPFINILINPSSPPKGTMKNKQTFNIFNPLREEQKKDIFHLKEVATHPIYNLLTHQKTKSGKIILQINERQTFNEEYEKTKKATSTPFNKKINYFSDFAERNDIMNVFGGLNARERPKQFFKVKNYSLDEKQAALQKIVRQNSQPSLMSRNNTSSNGFTPRLSNHRTTTSEFQFLSSFTPKHKKQLSSPHFSQNGNNARQSNMSESTFVHEEIQNMLKQKGLNNQHPPSRFDDKLEPIKSVKSFNIPKNKFIGKTGSYYSSQHKLTSLKSKVGMKSSQQTKILEDETAIERNSLAEFDHHLKFITGGDNQNSTQGSVFFRETKR